MLLLYGLVIVFGGCADKLILHPPAGHIDAGRATPLTVQSQGRAVEVWTARSPAAATDGDVEAYVLEFCGNATRAEQIAQYVADRWRRFPVEVWVMNYPGFGGSAGAAKLHDIPPAALATYDALRTRAGGKPIFLCGNSLGTTSALYVAANRPAAGLILQNPPPLRRLLLANYGWWNLWLAAGPVAMQVPAELNATTTAPHVAAPAVFMSATDDEVVPPKYQRLVYDAYRGEKRLIVISGATHNSSVNGDSERELQDGMDWLWERRHGASKDQR
ncbi:MAG: uncharacterized protein QOF78_2786 [Phycisphaerales bacterium]|jgi:alpha-beta hydrolase superfamily lysophospholipase|nr:uncharacterized protein [Phycisphaerales bacterium]